MFCIHTTMSANKYDQGDFDYELPSTVEGEPDVKVICLGDSAVGKSKDGLMLSNEEAAEAFNNNCSTIYTEGLNLIVVEETFVTIDRMVERFLLDDFKPHQLSTYALTLYRHKETIDGKEVVVDLWDTAGQENFQKMHPSYYYKAHSCILVFDVSRKVTYRNLKMWYKELREYRPNIPCLLVANKIDTDLTMTKRSFNFASEHQIPLHFVSASDGTNVVKVFKDAIKAALQYKSNPTDFADTVLEELDMLNDFELELPSDDEKQTAM